MRTAMSDVEEKPPTMPAQKLELSVASENDMEIAGENAHDFNNLLTIIVGHPELLAMENLSPEVQVKYIGRIEDATNHIRDRVSRAANSEVARDYPEI
jgi:signal transduction histidine kinase